MRITKELQMKIITQNIKPYLTSSLLRIPLIVIRTLLFRAYFIEVYMKITLTNKENNEIELSIANKGMINFKISENTKSHTDTCISVNINVLRRAINILEKEIKAEMQ